MNKIFSKKFVSFLKTNTQIITGRRSTNLSINPKYIECLHYRFGYKSTILKGIASATLLFICQNHFQRAKAEQEHESDDFIKDLKDSLHHIINEQGPSSKDAAKVYYNLGFAYAAKEEFKTAIAYYEKALAIIEKEYGKDSIDYASTITAMSPVWIMTGYSKRAIEKTKEAIEIKKKFYGNSHSEVAILYSNLAGAYFSLGDYANAIENLKISYDNFLNYEGMSSSHANACLINMSSCYEKLGDKKNALAQLQQVKSNLATNLNGDKELLTYIEEEMKRLSK